MTYENKLGMFIHWGIYALTELHEQAFARYDLDRTEYESLMHRFNPVDYDPEEWVLLAKRAGMKYICFTAKHHDGFCMWDTKYTDYNVMNTPYGRDVLKMLTDACQKHGMLLSLYYSNPDWHHEYGYNPASTHQWKAVNQDKPNLEPYREYIKNQVTELLTNYGKIYTFFWDIPPKVQDPTLNALVRKLQPGIYINDRGWDEGDFSTPEREYESIQGSRFTKMTEACNSVGKHAWGYRRNEAFYSIRYLTSSIDKIMAKGGSYLLNVGPNALGTITKDYADRIKKVGNWYNRMAGCLECHEEDPYDYCIQGNSCIVTKKDGKTYLHFPEGPDADAVAIMDYPSIPKEVILRNTGTPLDTRIEPLPKYFSGKTGNTNDFLHIINIPVDELSTEPIVIEIQW